MNKLRFLSMVAVTFGVSAFSSTAFAQKAANPEIAQKLVAPLVAPQAIATPNCVPGIDVALRGQYGRQYGSLIASLSPNVYDLTQLVDAVDNPATYGDLLNFSLDLAASTPNGRLLIALPDGTVVVDTFQPVDLDNLLPEGNSYEHFQQKTVNENHNTRVAIISAQIYPCGVGVESKASTTTGTFQSYAALRLGGQFLSSGTARLSITSPMQATTSSVQE